MYIHVLTASTLIMFKCYYLKLKKKCMYSTILYKIIIIIDQLHLETL